MLKLFFWHTTNYLWMNSHEIEENSLSEERCRLDPRLSCFCDLVEKEEAL